MIKSPPSPNLRMKKSSFLTRVKGMFGPSIPYEVRVPSGDWSEWFGNYQNQKWGAWDSNSCWCLSAVNCLEDQLEWLSANGSFSAEAKNFFQNNGYIDADGDFSISERYLEILGGDGDGGGTAEQAWKLMEDYGCIPRGMLNYTQERARSFTNKIDFNQDYFSMAEVTTEMKNLGKQFLKYVSIAHQRIGTWWKTPDRQVLQAALRQAPLQIGVPVPTPDFLWNSAEIIYDGSTELRHEVELYSLPNNLLYCIFDQYEPHLKTLSPHYYIPSVTQGVVTAIAEVKSNPIPQNKINNSVWGGLFDWFNDPKVWFR